MRRFLAPLMLLLGGAAHAHDVRPAYLEIVERPGDLSITWKRTAGSNVPMFTPRFSTGWTDSHPDTTRQAGEAIEKTWIVANPHAPLAGTGVLMPSRLRRASGSRASARLPAR